MLAAPPHSGLAWQRPCGQIDAEVAAIETRARPLAATATRRDQAPDASRTAHTAAALLPTTASATSGRIMRMPSWTRAARLNSSSAAAAAVAQFHSACGRIAATTSGRASSASGSFTASTTGKYVKKARPDSPRR